MPSTPESVGFWRLPTQTNQTLCQELLKILLLSGPDDSTTKAEKWVSEEQNLSFLSRKATTNPFPNLSLEQQKSRWKRSYRWVMDANTMFHCSLNYCGRWFFLVDLSGAKKESIGPLLCNCSSNNICWRPSNSDWKIDWGQHKDLDKSEPQ